MEMINLGYTYDEPCLEATAPQAPKTHYPYLNVNKMKASDGHKVGDEFTAVVKLKKKRLEEDDDGFSCGYDVIEISFEKPEKEKKSFADELDELVEGD